MNYSEMLAQIDALEIGIRTHGLDPRNTRLAKYKRDISILADPNKLKSPRTHFSEPELRELFFTFTEVNELHTIFSALSPQHENVLKPRFLEVITGPPSSAAEKTSNSGNRPRNFQFELLLASLFLQAGFPIMEDASADIRTEFMNRPIFVECKRPQRQTGIHAAIKDGVSQLKKRLSDDATGAVGILALSLSKVITEGDTMLRAPDASTALRILTDKVHQLTEPQVPYFHAQAQSSVAGILVHASAPTIPQNPPSIATVSMQIFFDNPQVKAEDHNLVEGWFQEYDRLEKLP